ncbi:hypothetical protein HY493_00355 [Candidatus Woesearchaeota archaeon]|nr:hypothetical protein [Candidatus Woesearchaeota archaeon]
MSESDLADVVSSGVSRVRELVLDLFCYVPPEHSDFEYDEGRISSFFSERRDRHPSLRDVRLLRRMTDEWSPLVADALSQLRIMGIIGRKYCGLAISPFTIYLSPNARYERRKVCESRPESVAEGIKALAEEFQETFSVR